jgi:hypothetical protein
MKAALLAIGIRLGIVNASSNESLGPGSSTFDLWETLFGSSNASSNETEDTSGDDSDVGGNATLPDQVGRRRRATFPGANVSDDSDSTDEGSEESDESDEAESESEGISGDKNITFSDEDLQDDSMQYFLLCLFGKLFPPTYVCLPDPCRAPHGIQWAHPAGLDCAEEGIIESGSVCIPECLLGYSPSASEMTCFLGELSPSTFSCSPDPCPAPEGVANAAEDGPCAEGSL